jgi:hypothetical protein
MFLTSYYIIVNGIVNNDVRQHDTLLDAREHIAANVYESCNIKINYEDFDNLEVLNHKLKQFNELNSRDIITFIIKEI